MNFKRGIRMKKNTVSKKKKFSPSTALLSLICVVLACFALYNIISLNELTLDISDTKDELEQLQSDNSVLAIQIERKNSLENIEEIATEQLGMVKLESYQIHSVNLVEDDSIEVVTAEKDRGFFDGIVASFNILVEYLN